MKQQKVTFVFLLFFIFLTNISFSQQSENLKFGTYKVGLKVVETVDNARTFLPVAGEKPVPRPVKYYVWFPAKEKTASKKLLFSDYADMMAKDFGIDVKTKSARVDTLAKYFNPFKRTPKEELSEILKTETMASLQLPGEKGTFPVIVFGQGYGYTSPAINYALCEYLASHGFIVASPRLIGKNSYETKVNLEDLEAETNDMNFILNLMKKHPNADPSKIGVIGFDLGGMAAMLLQIKNTSVKAMVSLDAGIMFEHNTKLLKESPIYSPSKLRVPLLHFMNTTETLPQGIIEDHSLIQMSKTTDRYIVRLKNMHHRDYTSLSRLGISDGSAMDQNIRKNHSENYQIISEYTLYFLDSFLRNNPKSKELLNTKSAIDSSFNNNYIFEHYEINK